jgi:hypothetical protein
MSAPKYDIVTMLEHNHSPEELLYSLWEKVSPFDRAALFEEERVVLDAWNFDSTYGNGINDLLVNENYDVITNGFRAMRVFGVRRLGEFAATLESVFATYGVECASGDSLAKVEQLPSSQRLKLRSELEVAESPFLKEFWHGGVLTFAANDYLMRNLHVFKRRRQ